MANTVDTWDPYELKKDGHAEWLVRTCELLIETMRNVGGIPTSSAGGYIKAYIPTLKAQSEVMNKQKDVAPGTRVPTDNVVFTD